MPSEAKRYILPDAMLSAYDGGLGTLTLDGELKGYLAASVGEIKFPSRSPWPWFVVVWLDGTKERAFEDYGPGWWTVRQLDAGKFTHHPGPGTREQSQFLWLRTTRVRHDPDVTFEFAWLPPEEATTQWKRLNLTASDF